MRITKILLETSQRTRIRSMIDMCHADEHRRGGETFQAEIMVQAVRASGIWETFSTLVLLGIKLEAGGQWQSLRLEFTGCPLAPLLSTRVMLDFYFKGHLGMSEEPRPERVSGHEESREEADAVEQ